MADSILERIANDPNLHISNAAAVRKKIESILASKTSDLHIISDFDMTCTKQHYPDGSRHVSSHSILMGSKSLPDEFRAYTEGLFKKYYPMEISTTLSLEEKVAAMVEWWELAHEAIVGINMKRSDIVDAVRDAHIVFRDGLRTLVETCKSKSIPLLIFSAGIADVIEQVLSQHSLMNPSIHVVSNKMSFANDADETCTGFAPPLIHVFNKSESSVENTTYGDAVKTRKNVLLLGDSIGDLGMGEGLAHDTELTIGFLNHDVERLIGKYEAAFDLVVLNDGSMEIVNAIVDAVGS
ncbi:pyrimidine 5'-nucleotidase [Cladochytrium replicatum]|nr:pyrimidine 5'-nucleotidase [Cladochytrium replicatum]